MVQRQKSFDCNFFFLSNNHHQQVRENKIFFEIHFILLSLVTCRSNNKNVNVAKFSISNHIEEKDYNKQHDNGSEILINYTDESVILYCQHTLISNNNIDTKVVQFRLSII